METRIAKLEESAGEAKLPPVVIYIQPAPPSMHY